MTSTLAITDPSQGVHKGVFNFIFGSYTGDWDGRGSILRSAIADPDGYGLTAAWGSYPQKVTHRTGLGGTMGDMLVATQNNYGSRSLYGGAYSTGGATTISLLGDPTLRQDVGRPALGRDGRAPTRRGRRWRCRGRRRPTRT